MNTQHACLPPTPPPAELRWCHPEPRGAGVRVPSGQGPHRFQGPRGRRLLLEPPGRRALRCVQCGEALFFRAVPACVCAAATRARSRQLPGDVERPPNRPTDCAPADPAFPAARLPAAQGGSRATLRGCCPGCWRPTPSTTASHASSRAPRRWRRRSTSAAGRRRRSSSCRASSGECHFWWFFRSVHLGLLGLQQHMPRSSGEPKW